MDITFGKSKNILYLYFNGELDEYTAKKSKDNIDKCIDDNINSKSVVFDFSNLTFMDSTGIGVLIGRYKKLKKYGINSYIKSPNLNVNKILELSGLYDIMPKL